MTMRVLVIDDERLARKELRRLLAGQQQFEIVGEAADVADGIARARALAPDLLLLNVQIPGGSGFDLLDALDDVPEVIFTTGHGHCPADYLLKPIHPQRLAAALERAAVRAGMGSRPRKLFIREGDRCWFVRLTDIRLFEAEGEHTRAYFDGAAPLIPRSLQQLEQMLDRQQFFRASSRHLVNLADVDRIVQTAGGSLALNVAGVAVEVMGATQ
ncbi:LytR/AlgR family response regulator transcription factor [Pseudoduganella sp. R-43]|uniref:LytR/AlgR family response regulator transcription factor n=1 Tax=unclassified Pseudoduganella TaxID=2637179 RepID=UPI003CE73395